MVTGDLRNRIDAIWDVFWSGGISNPIDVIEQLTFLLFLKRLDERHTAEEKKAVRLGRDIERPIFGKKGKDRLARWSVFKQLDPGAMYEAVRDKAFPFMKELGGAGSAYSRHMKDALFKIPTPALPPLPLQRKFDEAHRQIDSTKRELVRHADATDAVFASLQSAAFAGTLFDGQAARPDRRAIAV